MQLSTQQFDIDGIRFHISISFDDKKHSAFAEIVPEDENTIDDLRAIIDGREEFDYLRSELDMYSKSLSRLNHEIKILQDKQGFLSQKVEELDRKIEALKAEYGDPVLPVGFPRYDMITNTVNGRKLEVGMKVSLCRDGSNQILTGVVEHNPDANMHYSYLSPPADQKAMFIGGSARIYITGKHGVLIHNEDQSDEE